MPVVEERTRLQSVGVEHLSTWIRQRSDGIDRYLFGVAGPPGSGKSTMAAQLAGELSAPIVVMDGFHLPNSTLETRGLQARKGAPETFAADRFVELVISLRDPTLIVTCPVFDRGLDEPVSDVVRLAPEHDVVIIEGNYLLLDEPPWNELHAVLDAVAYLDVPDVVRRQRLVDRHVSFGRSHADAVEFVNRSDEANARRVDASRGRAHLLVTPAPQSPTEPI